MSFGSTSSEPLGLMDSHYLYVTVRKWLVRVLVLVDAAIVEEPQEALLKRCRRSHTLFRPVTTE
jgi:hypothetical protein